MPVKIFGPAVAIDQPIMETQRLALIANPEAGARNALELVSKAHRELLGYELDAIVPASRDELSRVCQALSPKSHRAAIIIGGDGTFNAAVQGLWKNSSHQDHSVPIYAFPGGTANDLSAELGLQQSFRQLQDLIDHRRLSPMDVITCNGVPFTTVAGIGVGASITQRFNDIRQRSRVFRSLIRTLKTEVYTAMSANAIITTRSYLHDVAIESDSFNKRMRIAALFVCNQNKLGGSLRVGQHNSNQDGIFGVLAVPADGPVSLLKTLLSIRSGQLPDHVISFSARELSVRSTEDRDIPVFGDGEILLRSRNLDFKIFPRSLMVYRDKAELN